MSIIVAIMLSIVYLTPILLSRFQSRGVSRDLLSPINVVAGFHLFTTVPFLVLIGLDEEALTPLVRHHPSMGDLEMAIVSYGLLQALAFIALVLGLASPIGRTIARSLPVVGGHFTPLRYFQALVVALIVGLGSLWLFFREVGGYEVMLDRMDLYAHMGAGFGYLLSLLSLLSFAVILVIYSMREKRSFGKYALALALFLLQVVMTSSLGGRYRTIQLVVLALLTWHYGVQPFRRISWRAVVLLFVVVPYMVALPLVRSQGALDRYSKNPDSLVSEVVANLDSFIVETSYVHHYLLIVSHFNASNVWMGASYRDLLLAPIPSSILPDKPPVDDGVYLRTIADGHEVTPGTPYHRLFQSSWPLESFGALYMNFWIPGLLLGMFILGIVYGSAYQYMRRSKYTLYSILVYAFVLSQFHLSNLRIVQVGMNLVLATVFCMLFFGLRFGKRRMEVDDLKGECQSEHVVETGSGLAPSGHARQAEAGRVPIPRGASGATDRSPRMEER